MILDNINEEQEDCFQQKIDEFIKYVKLFVEYDIKAILYLRRKENTIEYGNFDLNKKMLNIV